VFCVGEIIEAGATGFESASIKVYVIPTAAFAATIEKNNHEKNERHEKEFTFLIQL
jgi:hypothetical protein